MSRWHIEVRIQGTVETLHISPAQLIHDLTRISSAWTPHLPDGVRPSVAIDFTLLDYTNQKETRP